MNLILQSSSANTTTTINKAILQQIAALTGAQQIVDISHHALRCIDLQFTEPLRQQVETLALQQGIDVYWENSPRRLQDFKLLAMDMDSTLITIE